MREIGRGESEGNLLRKKYIALVGVIFLAMVLVGCSPIQKLLYPTKRSYNFNQIADRIVKDLEERNNKDLVTYFTINMRKSYGKTEIIEELKKAETGLGKVRNYKLDEVGKSGHRGGEGETVTTWELTIYTDQGAYCACVDWSDGDDSKGLDSKLYRNTEGIKRLMLIPKEFDTVENLSEFDGVDFPVLYPGIQR